MGAWYALFALMVFKTHVASGQTFNCSDGCLPVSDNSSDTCNTTTGECLLGCRNGIVGSDCSLECSIHCATPANNTSALCEYPSGNCTAGCISGYEGHNCSKIQCSDNCETDANSTINCDNNTGKCLFGCVSGFVGENCTLKCPENCRESPTNDTEACDAGTVVCMFGCKDGFAGEYCDFKCPLHCNVSVLPKNQTCDTSSGNCLLGCLEKYTGPTCSCSVGCVLPTDNLSVPCNTSTGDCDLGCKQGFAGTNCAHECPSNCGIVPDFGNATCNTTLNECLYGCIGGFAGKKCSHSCPDNCFLPPDNSSETCDVETDKCKFGCKLGYAGDNCSHVCPEHCFTRNDGNQTCDAINDTCIYGCDAGFAGDDCSFECPLKCTLPSDGGQNTCHIMNGSCLFGCKYGYAGSNCTFACPEHCGETFELFMETCDTNTSECLHGCKEGYTGSNCSVECPPSCKASTSERNDPVCDEHSRKCRFGCQDGYFGENCSGVCKTSKANCEVCIQFNSTSIIHCNRCIDNFFSKDGSCVPCSYWCSTEILPACNPMDGECWHGCKAEKRKMGKFCQNDCPTQCLNSCEQYTGYCTEGCITMSHACGPTCQSPCSTGCFDQACEQNCTCKNVCLNGFWGQKCDQLCHENCNKSGNTSQICETLDGRCRNGCSDNKWWGRQCEFKCPVRCVGSICQQETGSCIHGCNSNQVYGMHCDKQCPASCKNGTCQRLDGICDIGCITEFYGDHCEKHCNPNCLDKLCNRYNGTCTCETGFYGLTCELTCKAGCLSATCEALSGNCTYGCVSGYEGAKCDKLTAIPTFFDDPISIPLIGGGVGLIILVVIGTGLVLRRQKQLEWKKRKAMSEDELAEWGRKQEEKRQKGARARISQIFVENPLARMMQAKTNTSILNTKFRINEVLDKVVLLTFNDFSEEYDRLPTGLTRTHEVSRRLENLALNFYNGIYPYDENRVVLKRMPDVETRNDAKKKTKRKSLKSVHFLTFGKEKDGYVIMGEGYGEKEKKSTQKPLKSALKQTSSFGSDKDGKDKTDITSDVNVKDTTENDTSTFDVTKRMQNTKERKQKDNPYEDVGFDVMTKELDAALNQLESNAYDNLATVASAKPKMSCAETENLYNHMGSATMPDFRDYNKTTHQSNEENQQFPPPPADIEVGQAEYAVVQKLEHSNAEVNLNASSSSALFSKKGEKPNNNTNAAGPPGQEDEIIKKGDYYNASFIKVNKDNFKFIAAQAPSKLTVNDFWLMIWEQRVEMIVMLIDIKEGGFSRCEQYWPEKEEKQKYGEIEVTTVSEELLVNFCIRKMNLCLHGVERDITHFQYKAWPDDDSPLAAIDFIQFHQKYRSLMKIIGHSAPVLVHCTAGVGKTGVFIGLDTVFEEGRDSGVINIYACVERLREQRVNMVHTCDQYEFLYKAVAQTFGLECVPYNKSKIPEKLSDLKKFDDSGISRLEGIFKKMKISLQLDAQEIPSIEHVQEVRSKDRPTSDIPDVVFRARLPKNAYINAVLIDTLRDKDGIVCTQMPTPDTLTDFCQLIMHHEIETSVMLNVNDPNDKSIGFYWPKEKAKDVLIGTFKMSVTDVNKQADFVVRKLKLESLLAEENDVPREITMIQFKGWKIVKTLPNAKTLLSLLLLTRKIVNESNGRKLLVHCINGADQSGLFCALYNLLETLDLEEEVSITTIIRKILARRPSALPALGQLEACFTVAIQYLTQKF